MGVRSLVHIPVGVCLASALVAGCDEGPTVPDTTALQVSLRVTGDAPDPACCWVAVDGAEGQALRSGQPVTITGLSMGRHTVSLSGLASYCFVQGGALRTVAVAPEAVTPVQYVVNCPTPGSFEVATSTAGSGATPNGYAVQVDWTAPISIGLSDTEAITGLAAGDHVVKLSLGAIDCTVLGDNPRTVTAVEGVTIRIEFTVLCPPFYDHIAYSSGSDLWVVKPDGSNPVNITQDPAAWYDYPSWAPDAARIASTSSPGDVYVLAFDPRAKARLTRNAGVEISTWSPDGLRIAYSSFTGPSQGDAWGDIYVMNADGSDPVNLTPGASRGTDPAWSPDGQLIAYRGEADDVANIWVMAPDGSDPRPLTDFQTPNRIVHEPAWSPNGTRIAFVGPGEPCCGIWVVNADGSNPVQLVEGYTWRPTWSPDGTRIAYYDPGVGIFVMNADGTGSVKIATGFFPAWSPGQP